MLTVLKDQTHISSFRMEVIFFVRYAFWVLPACGRNLR